MESTFFDNSFFVDRLMYDLVERQISSDIAKQNFSTKIIHFVALCDFARTLLTLSFSYSILLRSFSFFFFSSHEFFSFSL